MMAGWGGGEGMVPERRQEHSARTCAISKLIILPGNAVY